jgi:hypothetical protein
MSRSLPRRLPLAPPEDERGVEADASSAAADPQNAIAAKKSVDELSPVHAINSSRLRAS